jgi:signal transduction histidine kinase
VSHLGVLAEEKQQSNAIERGGTGRGIGDRLVLRQALINLVDNAIKYTPQGGHIRIRILDAPGGPAIDVTDSEAGVAPEAVPRIFDRFDRGQQSGGEAGSTGTAARYRDRGTGFANFASSIGTFDCASVHVYSSRPLTQA